MSLSTFHLFFVTASFLLAVAVGVWGVRGYLAGGGGGILALGVVCLLLAVVLVPYGIKVRRKLKEIEEEVG